MTRMFLGYGRGWGEEKAVGFWPRFRQRMREPATTNDWIWVLAGTTMFYGAAIWLIGWWLS